MPAPWLRRVWSLPLWVDAVALATLLFALLPVLRTDGLFTADEGALLAQLEHLEATGDWEVPHPFVEADPEQRSFPLHLSYKGSEGFAPFVKHPAYPTVLRPLYDIGGVRATLALSVLGTVAAATVAALLARRLTDVSPRLVFWLTGLGSPLFFDSYLVVAHTIGAACAGAATLLLLRATDGGSRARLLGLAAMAGGLVAAGALLRNEIVLYGLALSLALFVLAVMRRSLSTVLLSAVPAIAGLAMYVVEPRIVRALVEREARLYRIVSGTASTSWLEERIDGIQVTLLRPTYDADALARITVVAVLLLGVAAVLLRRHQDPSAQRFSGLLAIAAAAIVVVRVVAGPVGPISGLLVAFPVLTVGVLLLGRQALADDSARVLAVTVAAFAAAVVVTQYAFGGGGEWGGRFFAVGMPAAIPVAAAALTRQLRSVPSPDLRRQWVGSLAVVTVALTVLAGWAIEDSDRNVRGFVDATTEALATTAPGDGGAPVLVTTVAALPRFSWAHLDEGRWLFNKDPEVAVELLDRLGELGVDEVLWVGPDEHLTPEVERRVLREIDDDRIALRLLVVAPGS